VAKTKLSPIPAGAYVEVNVDNIDEGRLKKKLESKIRQAYRALQQYEQETSDFGGKATVTLKVSVKREKGSAGVFRLAYKLVTTTPEAESATLAKQGADGQLICQPGGTTEDDPDQLVIFDQNGRVLGKVEEGVMVPMKRTANEQPPA
jgi:hypothetical protein